jgi:hypothetical protein
MLTQTGEFNLESHVLLTNYKKAFHEVICSKLWEILENSGFPSQFVNASQSVYKNLITATDKKQEV